MWALRSRRPEAPKTADAMGLVSHQLDRRGGWGRQSIREPLHLGAQHLGRLSAGRRQRQHPLAPGWPEELIQDGARAPKPPGSTTGASSPTAKSPSSTTARTRRSTSSRAACGSRSTSRPTKRISSRPTRTPIRRCSPQARATCRLWPTATPWWAMAACPRSASSPRGAHCCSTPTCPSTCPSIGRSAFPGAGAR